MKWQPIETAPAEGPYLVYGGTCFSELNDEGETALVTKVEGRDGAYYFNVADVCYYGVWVKNPTHWMPLPAAPKGETP
jgi:hypothetical protein